MTALASKQLGLTLSVPRVTKINFLLTISMYNQVERLRELTKWSLKKNALSFKQIFSTTFSRKCMEANQENLYVDLGSERVKAYELDCKQSVSKQGTQVWEETHHFFLVVPVFLLMLNSWRLLSWEHFLCWLLVPAGLLIVTVAVERLSIAFTANSKRVNLYHMTKFSIYLIYCYCSL